MAPSATQRQASQYPEALTVMPRSGNHLQSFIILHGRGSNADNFGAHLLLHLVPGFGTLQDAFPNAKFVFPTASKRRAQIYKRTAIHQWFDNWSLQTPTEREELQFDGLAESSRYIHGLLETEIATVGAEHVVLWGLSQGCAISLIAMLLWEGPRFAAAIGMCGWLPLRKRMEDVVRAGDVAQDEDNPFASESPETSNEPMTAGSQADKNAETSNIANVVQYLREELQMPSDLQSSSLTKIPIFLGHGAEDEKVPLGLSKEAAGLLRLLDFNVEYKEYQGLNHWYSGQMLKDIVHFIRRETGGAAL